MPGRPRRTAAELDDLISAYCSTYGVPASAKWGLPPYPRIDRKTQQFREYWRIYKTATRIHRNEGGLCVRCSRPASQGSVLCAMHRARMSARNGGHGATADDRQQLSLRQGGLCPVCQGTVDLWDSVDHDHRTKRIRGLLHGGCNRLVAFFETAGRQGAMVLSARIAAYLRAAEPSQLPSVSATGVPRRGGRPRLSLAAVEHMQAQYCRQYQVRGYADGRLPRPNVARTSQQFRDFERIRLARWRLARREAQLCVRCDRSPSQGSVFCDVHRAANSAVAGRHAATEQDRLRLHGLQKGICPICACAVEIWDAVDHQHDASGRMRGILHSGCNHLVGYVEKRGADVEGVLANVRAYLSW